MKTKSLVVLFLAVGILLGCASGKPKIGLLVHSFETPRWQNDQKYFIEAVESMGAVPVVNMAENDDQKQINQAKDMINSGVSVLVVIPVNQFSASAIVELAHKKNVKVIAYDRLINNCLLDYYVSTDNVKIGELQAEYIVKVKPSGNYGIIGGPNYDNNSRMIYLGQMDVLQPLVEAGSIKIIYNNFANDWSEAEGYRHAVLLLDSAKNKVDAIIAGNDAIAMGVLKALKERSLEGKVALAGQDADLPNIQQIIKGNQTMTVYKPIRTMAYTAAELAFQLAKDELTITPTSTISNGERLVPSFLLDAVGVNEANIRMTVIAEGYQSETDVFK